MSNIWTQQRCELGVERASQCGTHSLYRSTRISRAIKTLNIGRRSRWIGHISLMEAGMDVLKPFIGKATEKRPLGRPRSKWDGSIKVDFKQISVNTRS